MSLRRRGVKSDVTQSNQVLDIDALFARPGSFTADPSCLNILGLDQDDVPMLVDLLMGCTDEGEQAHLLQLLSHLNLGFQQLTHVTQTIDVVQGAALVALLMLMSKSPTLSIKALCTTVKTTQDPVVWERGCHVIASLGHTDSDAFDGAEAALTALLQQTEDPICNAYVVVAIEHLHYLFDQNPDVAVVDVKENVMLVVKEAYRKHQVDIDLAGGFVDFLEASNWAINPDDEVVKDVQANISCKAELEERAQAHNKRIEAFRDEWVEVHQQHRADRLGKLLTRALLLFGSFFGLQLFMLYFERGELPRIITNLF
eukprot:m.61782 g.61782  ORF g.61782 m.61782 type:complete len:314 (-) comp13903_c0_seq2:23-964(-)